MFTFEAWFRFDPIDLRPNGYLSQVFALYDAAADAYRLGFGVTNTFLRVYLDDYIQDIHYLFNETTEFWHYVAVSYMRTHEHETYLWIYIDNILFLETSVLDWFHFDRTSADYWLHIARDFPGIVRKAKINSRPYCLDRKSLWISTDETLCNMVGSYPC
mmetsp:Transcript_32671/g.31892  ORF Transcript_32671/g.31892 Transcript_32671/m.31892 type:complete len:159 (+) Transcript_32671:1178-1654(+)